MDVDEVSGWRRRRGCARILATEVELVCADNFLNTKCKLFITKMSACCVPGCKNRHCSTSKLKFYRIPSGYRPFQANRRRLWLQAIKQVDGSAEEVKSNARICGAHFISGMKTSPLSMCCGICSLISQNVLWSAAQGRRPWTTTVRTLCPLCSRVANRSPAPRKKGKGNERTLTGHFS